jgi:hypothetical protein
MRMIFKQITFLFFCTLCSECAAEDFTIVESSQVQYEGDWMALEGPVSLESNWGKIQAARARLRVPQGKGNFQFSHITLEDDVKISLKDKGELHSRYAEFDREKGWVQFTVPKNGEEYVTYSTVLNKDEKNACALEIKSKRLLVTFNLNNIESQTKSEPSFEAEDSVQIIMGGQFKATCKNAIYNGNTIALYENVKVNLNENGILTSNKEIQLQRDIDGKWRYLKCIGDCEYHSSDVNDFGWKMLCFGEILFDKLRHKLFLKSVRNQDGIIPEDRQVYFSDFVGKIFSNSAVIDLDPEIESFALKTVLLEGNVRLINREGALQQYILADRVTYDHGMHQMHFWGSKNRRVLFFDKINNLQVSASEMKMQRDKTTKKEQFQGIGDVRFHFAEKEYEQIRKRFLLEKSGL